MDTPLHTRTGAGATPAWDATVGVGGSLASCASSSPSSRSLSCVGGLAEDSDESEDPSEALCTLVWCWRMRDNMCSIEDSACGSAFKHK